MHYDWLIVPVESPEIPKDSDEWETEESRHWYGGENSGGWCGWRICTEVFPTNFINVYDVYKIRYFQNTSYYSRYEDDRVSVRKYRVKVVL